MVRWHTFEPGIPDETAERQRMQARIGEWWQAFAAQAPAIARLHRGQEEFDLFAWMDEHFSPVGALAWEFGPGSGDGDRLVITCENDHASRPLVETIISAAPILPGWTFHPWRLSDGPEQAIRNIASRTGAPWTANGCRIGPGNGHAIDVSFCHPAEALAADPDLAQRQAIIAVDELLGEEALARWFRYIDAIPAGPGDLPLDGFAGAFARVRDDILAGIPPDTYQERRSGATWHTLSIKHGSSLQHPRANDQFTAITMDCELWTAAHRPLFHSSRFSTREVFAYLKIDGKDGLDPRGGFGDRGDIEDAINGVLNPAGLGCVIGGGTGRRYSYIDLALTDWRTALPGLRACLRQGFIPKESWLLFFDEEWADEWLGIYPETPAPPGCA